MISTQSDKLVIEIKHPSPEDFLKDLRQAIIGAIQFESPAPGSVDLELLLFTNYTLLELLKNLESGVK